MSTKEQQIAELEKDWAENPRWKGIKRGYSAADVVRLRGSFPIEYTVARRGAEKLWNLVNSEPYVNCLGALTGGQAMQQVKAGVKAIYLSGWQVAADNNSYAAMYPDQSLYPVDSVPKVVERINNSFRRADEIQFSKDINPGDKGYIDYFAPIVADAEAGFGGVLNAFELMKAMIRAGAAGVHWEDQLASVKKCGHMGGKVLVPTQEAVQKLIAARFAADVCGVPTLVIARTDAEAADLLTSDCDDNDKPFVTGERTSEGFYKTARVCSRRSRAPSPTPSMPTSSGAKPARRISSSPASSPRPCAPSTRARCWPTTARRRSTGRRTSTTRRSPSSSGTRRHGLQVPVHHPRRHPQHVVPHVRPGAGLRRTRHDGLRREGAGTGIRGPRPRLHLRLAPAGSRYRLLRRGHHRHPGRHLVGHRADRFDRRRAVPLSD
jgi:hypothetical protein